MTASPNRRIDPSCWAAFDNNLDPELQPLAIDLHAVHCLLDDYFVEAADRDGWALAVTSTEEDTATADLARLVPTYTAAGFEVALSRSATTDVPVLFVRRHSSTA